MRIVFFGVGEIYRINKGIISNDDEVIAFIDNDKQLQGTIYDGIKIFSPMEIGLLPYDKIVIMSMRFNEMKKQLLQLGCERKRILHYKEYISQQSSGQLNVFYKRMTLQAGKKCLIITNILNYTGGSIVAVYTALELQKRGYEVVIAAPKSDIHFITEFKEMGIIFFVYPNLQYAKWNEIFWIKYFDKIIVNTYPMVLVAIEISKYRKVALWLHENDIVYPGMDFWKDVVLENINNLNLMIYAVSHVARENFFNNLMECEINLIPYGIPDKNIKTMKATGKLKFAVIGTIHPIKRQLLFLEAVKQMNKLKYDCEYLIIGGCTDIEYGKMVEREAGKIPNTLITGELTRKGLEELYSQIDIVVVPSSQETMSLVATEAMMYGKVCILSDIAGMAEYVKHGENGLIFRSNAVDDLVKQMSYCVDNEDKLMKLRENARKTYIRFFSMDVLGDRVEHILIQQD